MNYGSPKKLPDGRYYVKVLSDRQARVMVQLNRVTILTRFDDSEDLTIELNEKSQTTVKSIDDQNIAASKANCVEWFTKQLADQTLDAAYTRSMSDNKMNVTKAIAKGASVTRVFAADKTAVDSSVLEPGIQCDVILEFSGIWFMKKTFGPVWRVMQVRLLAPPKNLYPDEYLFQDADETPDAEETDI